MMTQKLIIMGAIATASIGLSISYSGVGGTPAYSQSQTASANSAAPKFHHGYTKAQAQARYAKVIKLDNCETASGFSDKKEFAIKKGYPFMLDNQDGANHTFVIGGQNYLIPDKDFAIISVSSTGQFDLTCDNKAVGKIIVRS